MATATADRINRAAEAFFTAAAKLDAEGFLAATREDAVLWQNTDGRGRSPQQVLRHIGRMRETLGRWEYLEVRRLIADEGFCEQHVVRFHRPDGTTHDIEACVVARVDDDGRITRLDEYVDGSSF